MAEATAISSSNLKKLLKDCRGAQADADSIKEGLKDLLSTAENDYGLNKKIFALIRRLDKLEPEELAVWIETFDDYFVKSGLKARADSAPSFQLDEKPKQETHAQKPKGTRKPKATPEEAGDEDGAAALH
jgi:hypothetical protein